MCQSEFRTTPLNGGKLQWRMSRTASCWPSVLWLHCTGHYGSTWFHIRLLLHSKMVRQSCNHLRCKPICQYNLSKKTFRFCLSPLLSHGLYNSRPGRENNPYCCQEHSHPNSEMNNIGSTWCCVLQNRVENFCYIWASLTKFLMNMKTTFRGTQRQFLENICSEDDLRYRIFGTFVVKFLACPPLLGFPNPPKMI